MLQCAHRGGVRIFFSFIFLNNLLQTYEQTLDPSVFKQIHDAREGGKRRCFTVHNSLIWWYSLFDVCGFILKCAGCILRERVCVLAICIHYTWLYARFFSSIISLSFCSLLFRIYSPFVAFPRIYISIWIWMHAYYTYLTVYVYRLSQSLNSGRGHMPRGLSPSITACWSDSMHKRVNERWKKEHWTVHERAKACDSLKAFRSTR